MAETLDAKLQLALLSLREAGFKVYAIQRNYQKNTAICTLPQAADTPKLLKCPGGHVKAIVTLDSDSQPYLEAQTLIISAFKAGEYKIAPFNVHIRREGNLLYMKIPGDTTNTC